MTITACQVEVLEPRTTAITAPRFAITSVHDVGVWLFDDTGIVGFGYAYVFDEGAADALANLAAELGSTYVGTEACSLRCTRSTLLTTKVNFLGVRGLARVAAAALDLAAWDLLCRQRGTNLPGLVGAERPSVPALAATGLWAGLDPGTCAQVANQIVEAFGTRYAKIWVGSADLGFEAERICAAREALGPDGGLVVDAAQAYDWRTAVRLAGQVAHLDLLWFEDPVEYEDLAGLAAFAAGSPVPLGTGEHVYGLDQLKQLLDLGSTAVVCLDLERIGGVTDFLAAAALCEAYRMPLASHCFTHVSVQVLATARTGRWCELVPLWDGRFGPATVRDGCVWFDPGGVGVGLDHPHPPERPGERAWSPHPDEER